MITNGKKTRALLAGIMMTGLMGAAVPAEAADITPEQASNIARVMPSAGSLYNDIKNKEDNLPIIGDVDIEVREDDKPELNAPEDLKVQTNGFVITGQDIFEEEKLLSLLEDKKGKLLSFKELQQGADNLTTYFHDKGYLTARVYLPVQKITGGIVEYTVSVGKLGKVTINNHTSIRDSVIRRESAALKHGEYIRRNELERAIWLMSDLAGADAKATLTRSEEDGSVDVIIELNPHSGKQGLLTVDNYGSRYTGYYEATLCYDFLNLAHEGDHLAVTGLTTGQRMFNGGVNYTIPVLTDGMKLSTGYNVLSYKLGDIYDVLDAYGTSHVTSVGLDYAIRRSQRNNLYVGLHYEGSELDDVNNVLNHYADKHSDAGILSVYGDEQDHYGATVWRLEYKRGWIGSNVPKDGISDFWVNYNDLGAYRKARFNFLRRQNFNERLYVLLSARGQYAFDNLDSSEHFSLGGISGVRAYPQSECSGDTGYTVRAELRWRLPVKSRDQLVQLAGYFDHGGIWYNHSGGADNKRFLQGAGVGLIWTRPDDWFVRMDYAWRIGANKPTDSHFSKGRFWVQGGVYF